MTAWFGSKATSGLSQAIIAAMPPHDVYIEPFLGGGAIMKRDPPAIRPRYAGVLVHDCWANCFACDRCRHQLCGSNVAVIFMLR